MSSFHFFKTQSFSTNSQLEKIFIKNVRSYFYIQILINRRLCTDLWPVSEGAMRRVCTVPLIWIDDKWEKVEEQTSMMGRQRADSLFGNKIGSDEKYKSLHQSQDPAVMLICMIQDAFSIGNCYNDKRNKPMSQCYLVFARTSWLPKSTDFLLFCILLYHSSLWMLSVKQAWCN